MKFRKKPVVVDAEQWFPEASPDVDLHDQTHPYACGVYLANGSYAIDTLEGPFRVTPGDWIITGVKGERYPCRADIFALTYEPMEEAAAPA